MINALHGGIIHLGLALEIGDAGARVRQDFTDFSWSRARLAWERAFNDGAQRSEGLLGVAFFLGIRGMVGGAGPGQEREKRGIHGGSRTFDGAFVFTMAAAKRDDKAEEQACRVSTRRHGNPHLA